MSPARHAARARLAQILGALPRFRGLEDVVELMPVAVGDHAGTLSIRTDATGGDNNAFFTADGDSVVPLRTLDEIVMSFDDPLPVTTMKIDVEGYEPFVIAGARKTIERDRPVILAEFCRERMAINGCSMRETWDFFRRLSYRGFRLHRGRLIQLDEPGDFENIFLLPEECTSSTMACTLSTNRS